MTGLSPVGRVSCWYPVARFRRLKKFLRYRRGAQEISARSRCISRRLRNLILSRLIPAMLPLDPRSRKINLAGLSLSSPPKTSRAWPHHRVHPLRHDRSESGWQSVLLVSSCSLPKAKEISSLSARGSRNFCAIQMYLTAPSEPHT